MAARSRKKYYTVAEANATLPLLRVILRDITLLAEELRERYQRLERLRRGDQDPSPADQDEAREVETEFERGQERMVEYEHELHELGVELKDYFTGLIDFRCLMDGREVYLCWKLGEPEVGHWHELDAGFAGRQKLAPKATEVRS